MKVLLCIFAFKIEDKSKFMNRGKILISDYVHELLPQGLESDGFEIHRNDQISLTEVHDCIHEYRGIVINSKIKADKTLMDKSIDLQFIARLGSGLEIIDQVYAQEKGIAVINSPEGNRNAVAEHAMGMLLMFLNHLHRSNAEVKALEWNREKNRGAEIAGKTVGIIGFGHTGSQFAKKLMGWDAQVLAYDKYKTDYTKSFAHVSESTPEKIIRQSDIISFHLPLTEETHYYVDEVFFKACKPNLILLNTSRGKVIKLSALRDAIQSKRIAGACLDVLENEKLNTLSEEEQAIYKDLFANQNVILSPHVAGWTKESLRKIAEIILERIRATY